MLILIGQTLRPFIPNLVERLLGLFSTLEPEEVNYLHLNASKYNTTEEEIDKHRSNFVSGSPLMESIERCLDLLDESTMSALAPCLQNVIKTAIGMPSKVGCSAVLVSLSTRHSFVFKPHADLFLKSIEKAVLDRNSTVSSAYARATGYVARLGSDQQLLKLASYSKNLYFAAEDEAHRQVSADIVYSVSKYATDRFNSLAAEFLPFVFLAKHDFDDHVREQFDKTWSENVGGSRAVLLYLKEILSLSVERLDSPKWTIKHTAAVTIADVVTSAGTDISLANAETIWPALEKALALKTFDGKEKVLGALVKICKDGRALWQENSAIAAQMKKIAIREAKRNNDAYRPHAFKSLGEYAAIRTDTDMFEDVYGIISSYIEDVINEDKMDTSDDKQTSQGTIETATITSGVAAVLRAINITQGSSKTPQLAKIITLLSLVLKSPKANMATRTTLYERSIELFNNLKKNAVAQADANSDIPLAFITALELDTGAGSEVVRTKRAEAAESIALTLNGGLWGSGAGVEEAKQKVASSIRQALQNERAASVKGVYERTLVVLERK
jgi:proteasome component ECM29